MAIKQAFACDACGNTIDKPTEMYTGTWAFKAARHIGAAQWHACDAKCAAKCLKDVVAKLEAPPAGA